jgi:hypothetical protein
MHLGLDSNGTYFQEQNAMDQARGFLCKQGSARIARVLMRAATPNSRAAFTAPAQFIAAVDPRKRPSLCNKYLVHQLQHVSLVNAVVLRSAPLTHTARNAVFFLFP